MPKRSNHFQRLVFRLQAALHDSECKIEESAMVQNHSSGNMEEIDVLVTFTKGELNYRTAIACRDHVRPAGPGWIRELAKQREHCRLDKVVAFHSKGFTEPARRSAEDENITVFTTAQIDHVDFKAALELPDYVMTVGVSVQLEAKVYAEFPPEGGMPNGTESGLAAVLIDGKEMGPQIFEQACKALITEWCQNQICDGGTISELQKAYSQVSFVEYRAHLPAGSLGRLNSGGTFPIASVLGSARVQHELRYAFDKGRYRVGKHAVIDAEAAFFGRGARLLVATDGEQTKTHVEAKPGTDLTINSFSRERRAPDNPFPSFEVAWAPESTMMAGPGVG